jgi:phosphatidylserine/phosphatidylglycerophosphate/cardiolipin synthase-like enzyme
MSDASYIGQIEDMLKLKFPTAKALWNVSTDNKLEDDWLWATPINVWGLKYEQFKQAVPGKGPLGLQTCTVADGSTQSCELMNASRRKPDDAASKLLIGHSDRLVDAMYDVMISAEVLLDVTSLSTPEGRFLDSLKDALEYLSNKPDGKRPIVRILISNPDTPTVTASSFLKDITSALAADKGMQVYVYILRSGILSWNHSKIVAADGVRAVVGGHNQWGAHYLGTDPVFDLSMRLAGTAARHAQDYANNLWDYGQWIKNNKLWFVDPRNLSLLQAAYRPVGDGPSQLQTGVLPGPGMYDAVTPLFPAPESGGAVPVLSVGRGGQTRSTYMFPTPMSYLYPFTEPSDEALIKLVSLAKHTIRMSLQAFRASGIGDYLKDVTGWNPAMFLAMGEALKNGVEIYVVLSNPGAVAGGLGPSQAPYDTTSPSTVNSKMIKTLTDRLKVTEATAKQTVAKQFHVATIRYSAQPAYPSGRAISNHAKTLIVDDSVFYIGSQNLYLCNLNEFGYIVEDPVAAKAYIDRYWTPLWTWSGSTATTDIDADAEASDEAEAMEFIMALRRNTMLNVQWSDLMDQYTKADDTARPAVEEQMDELIASAGFDTTSTTVLAGLNKPFFTDTPPSTAPTAEALRFMTNLMKSPELMAAFGQAVLTSAGSGDAYNAAIIKFLRDRGYSCTVLEVMAAFSTLRDEILDYWSGTYSTCLTDDGGASYQSRPSAGLRRAATDTAPVAEPGPPLVVDSHGVAFDGVAVVKYLYDDNTLTWSSSDGNATSASLQFGTVTRPTANDNFQGNQCFGTITYPDSSGPGRHGVYSFYGQAPLPAPPPDPSPAGSADSNSFTLAYVFGALALVAVAAIIAYCRVKSQRQADRIAAEQGSRRTEFSDTEMRNLASVGTPGQTMEYAITKQRVLQDQNAIGIEQVKELTTLFEGMSLTDKNTVASSAQTFRDEGTALDTARAWDLPRTVQSSGLKVTAAATSVNGLGDSLMSRFSTDSQARMRRSIESQKSASTAYEKLNSEEGKSDSMEFDYDWDKWKTD